MIPDKSAAPGLRVKLKALLPAPTARFLAGGLNYARRMRSWVHVMRVVRGRTAADRMVLWRSLFRAPLEMLRELGNWREPQLLQDAEVCVRGGGTFAIRARSDDLGHVLPGANAAIVEAMRPFLRAGDVAIDAGANIGAVTVFLARQVGPAGRVLAVEMMPDTAKRLQRNLVLNASEHVEVVQHALSDRAGQRVTAEVAEGLYGQASISAVHHEKTRTRQVEVSTTTLDDLTRGLQDIAVIKMDLEGAEALAIAGGRETLRRTRAVVFESWAGDGGRTGVLLAEAGFDITPVDGRNFLASRRPAQEARQP